MYTSKLIPWSENRIVFTGKKKYREKRIFSTFVSQTDTVNKLQNRFRIHNASDKFNVSHFGSLPTTFYTMNDAQPNRFDGYNNRYTILAIA